MTEKPQFQHDCPHCTFLGRWQGPDHAGDPIQDWDLYACVRPKQGTKVIQTVIARFGGGPEYASGNVFAGRHMALTEAALRARKQFPYAPFEFADTPFLKGLAPKPLETFRVLVRHTVVSEIEHVVKARSKAHAEDLVQSNHWDMQRKQLSVTTSRDILNTTAVEGDTP